MNKLENLWENITIFFDMAVEYRKTSITLLIAVFLLGYIAVTRTGPMLSCSWQAMAVQSVPSDKWRFNMTSNDCQYYNGTRWIALDKVVDVGAGGGVLEDMDL